MAQAQAPPPAPAQPGYNPAAAPTPVKKRRGCFGCGCGGCLLAILLIIVLVAAAIFFFAILPASAGSDTPTTLSVFLQNTQVSSSQNGSYSNGSTGQTLNPGTWVRTDQAGRGAINFPDGSITRLAPSTQVGITQATLDSHGALHHANLQQESGRTLSTVESLVGGGQFGVKGHGIDAEVRGTEFEIFVRTDGTILVKLFVGKLQLGASKNSVNLNAGQQSVVDAGGRAGNPGPIAPEPGDPFLLSNGPTGSETVAGNGNQKGTLETSPSPAPLAQGGTASSAVYNSPGGDMTVALSYPGSLMKLEVLNSQNQVIATGQGPPPIVVKVPAAPPGAYVGRITGISLAAPEAWSVSFATNPPCRTTQASDYPDTGPIRIAVADSDINSAFASSGLTDAGVSISPTAGGAVISGHLSYTGASLAGTVVVYAAPPNLGLTLVAASVNGIPVTAQVGAQLAKYGGRPLTTVEMGFSVDRVYGCKGPQGGLMVIEGHR
ncbi:MAG TPA: FecR family protein [Candidatus Dormibacteraeota bacterium]